MDQGGHGQATLSGAAPRRRGGGERSMVPPSEPRSYYGEPVIAQPTWTPEIAAYFFTGGVAGAAAPLAFFARSAGNDVLARRATMVALGGAVVSPVLLIKDLGRPARFLYMLRVFKITSPMSVGSWVLSGFGTAVGISAGSQLTGWFPRAGRAAGAAGLVLGPLLSTYTAALIANTAVPVWHDARRELPFIFGSSAVGTAGALTALVTPADAAGPAWRMAAGGAAVELVALKAMEKRLGWIGEPYHQGSVGRFARAAKGVTAGGGALVGASALVRRSERRSRGRLGLTRGSRRLPVARRWERAARAGAVAILAGGMLERWAVFRAGFVSAEDPRYTVGPQRERAQRSGSAAEVGGAGMDVAPVS